MYGYFGREQLLQELTSIQASQFSRSLLLSADRRIVDPQLQRINNIFSSSTAVMVLGCQLSLSQTAGPLFTSSKFSFRYVEDVCYACYTSTSKRLHR